MPPNAIFRAGLGGGEMLSAAGTPTCGHPAKLGKTMAQKQFTFTPVCWNKWWNSLKMMTEVDRLWKSGWFHVREHLLTKVMLIQIQAKPTYQLLKNLKLKIDGLGYVSLDCPLQLCPPGQVDKRYSQTVWSPFTYPVTFQGGGLRSEWEAAVNHA